MAQLNKFIKVLHDRGGNTLTLADGEPIAVAVGGKQIRLSRTPVTRRQIESLLREIAPGDVAVRVGSAEVEFSYAAPTGAVAVRADATGARAEVRPSGASPAAPATRTAAAPVARVVEAGAGRAALDGLLERLVEAGGSDLHLRVGQPPLFRRDGRLEREGDPAPGPDAIAAMLDAVMPPRDKDTFAATGDADFAYELEGIARFRVNAARDRGGPMAVLRVIPSAIPDCDQLDITPEVRDLCQLTKGLVVVTGPTGSGKSTTLAALVDLMNRDRQDHILTIEDLIEFVHESKQCLVTHRQVGLHTESFKSGLRAALREDPDIILIGELRDLETVAIAIETAETGHLVFGTLHTTTAASTIDRIIDQFPADRQAQIRVMLSESLRGVVAQTLCRRKGGGRVAAREILLTTPAVSNLIREGKTYQIPSIIQTNRKAGMISLHESLMQLVQQGIVEPKEAYMKAVDKPAILAAMKAAGHDCSFVNG